jgi:wyosine [tRNA(Phe)-imidazoG37] synthetase (radical SAM superfamily)
MRLKRIRSVFVGPNMTLQFENEATIRYQIQEMLRIEKTFEEEGIMDELEAYNPLIPDGTNLKCTQMIEFPDEDERKVKLAELVNIENRTYVQIQGFDRVYAIADEDLERSSAEKTSSVHFSRFEFTAEMIVAIKKGAAIAMGSDHPNYNYRVDEIDPETQGSLIDDFA